jgi:hypothetical protein
MQFLDIAPDFKLNPAVQPLFYVSLFSSSRLGLWEVDQMGWIHPAEQRTHHSENECRVLVKYPVTMSALGDIGRSWLSQLQNTWVSCSVCWSSEITNHLLDLLVFTQGEFQPGLNTSPRMNPSVHCCIVTPP